MPVSQLQHDNPAAMLLASASDRLNAERHALQAWAADPAACRSHPLHHGLEEFFANIIDGLIDADAVGLSVRFNEYAQAVDAAQVRARVNPDAPAVAQYLDDNPTALHEYASRLAEFEHWCNQRVNAIRAAANDDAKARAADDQQQLPADDDASGTLTGEDKVLALFIRHPDWTDTKLASEAGVNRSSLHRMHRFQQAKAAMKDQAKSNYRRRQSARQGSTDSDDE